jgi:hypothetical protein
MPRRAIVNNDAGRFNVVLEGADLRGVMATQGTAGR